MTTNTSKQQQTTVIPLGSVAVGDTFLFSACSYQQTMSDMGSYYGHVHTQSHHTNTNINTNITYKPYMHYADPYCITHAIPYYSCVYGGGVEDTSVKHLLACVRLPRM